jgi:hypothetical protein
MRKTDRSTARTNQARPHGGRPPSEADVPPSTGDRPASRRDGTRPRVDEIEAERPTDEDVDPERGGEAEPRIEDENPDRHSDEP